MPNMPEAIERLIETFRNDAGHYRSPAYNETRCRIDFINPMFKVLGWDMDNQRGYAAAYCDVIHEDAIKVGGETKAPDYCFRIGGTRKFFLEAKKPGVNLKLDPVPAFQLRRYAWSAKLPLSILTDFEEFAIYDCRIKPDKDDKASAARIFYCTFEQYPEKWDEIASIFARESILKGSFDRYAETTRRKRGTAEVDDAFLREIDRFRDLLARNLALRNDLSQRDLNFAVQRTIDRIIFLRICEDRGIEVYAQLRALVNGPAIYKRLCELYNRADEKYNSGLFHFREEKGRHEAPDELTPRLTIDDKVLKDIIKGLYYPDSPYEFSVLPADILGQVYEQFLGKIIRLTGGGQAKIEEKPEVRKAGGVYYTPTYIVDYIVKNTVGRLLGVEGLGYGVSGSKTPDPKPETRNPHLAEHTHGTQNVPGTGSVESSHGPRGRHLSTDSKTAGQREVRTDQPTSTGSGLDPVEYRGRLRSNAPRGLSASSLDRQGLADGGGDAPDHHSPSEVGDTGTGQGMLGPIAAGRPDVDQARGLPQTPDPKPQTRSLTPKEAAKLRILDPACGSGSFLIGAYQYLLDWHLDWYTNNEPDKWLKGKNPAIYQVGRTTDVAAGLRTGRQDVAAGLRTGRQDVAAGVPAGRTYRLTSSKRKEILLNNIYGVDIDPQAVEVTKLSLLLKVLEGETGEALNNQFRLFHERALPDLGDNIKCGNSLIGPDFYDHQQMLLLDDDEKLRINVFDWNKEFPDIMKSGGFDAVIGNPPYGFHQIHADYLKPYLKHRFVSSEGSFEHYFLFYERTLQLLRPTGRHGFIVPVTWLTIPSAASLRRFVLDSYAIEKLVWLPELVFRNAQVNTLISIISKKAADTVEVEIHDSLGFTSPAAETRMYPQKLFVDAGHYIGIFERPADSKIIERINEKSVPMSEVARPCSGYNPYEVGSGENPGGGPHTERTVEEKPYHSQRKLGPAWKPEIVGRDLARYAVTITGSRWVKYGPWLSAPRDPTNFVGKRLLVQEIVGGRERRIVAAYYDGELYHSRDVIPIKLEKEQPHPYYLLGIINSHLLTWYHHRRNPKAQKGLFPKVLVSDLKKLPVRQIDFSNRVDRANHDRMVSLVDQMLKLHERLAAAKPGHDRDAIQRQIDATDAQIDRLVYDLYALTEEEIKIVEETITK